ncbi:MAG: choice-of-anchor Q domain-containing protein [Planctomycetota bacterium]
MFIHCTITANTATQFGGALFDTSTSNVTITNCIIWNNGTTPVYNNTGGTATVTYSSLEYSITGTGNRVGTPLFANAADLDGADNIWRTADDGLRLLSTSLCIDKGLNSAVPVGVTTDITGAPRIVDGPDADATATVDMGAYEDQN